MFLRTTIALLFIAQSTFLPAQLLPQTHVVEAYNCSCGERASATNSIQLGVRLDRSTGIYTALRTLVGCGRIMLNVDGDRFPVRITLANASQLLDRANQTLGGKGQTILDDTQKTLASLRTSSERVEQLLNSNYDSVNGGLNGLGEIGPAIRELRSTLEDLRGVTRRLQENPTGYLLGRERNKEFQP